MRTVVSVIAAIMVLVSTTIVAMAGTVQLNMDETSLKKGDSFILWVNMDSTMDGEFRAVQGELEYDANALSYLSHQFGEGYTHYIAGDRNKEGCFAFSNTDYTERGFAQIPEGTVVQVRFLVNDTIKKGHMLKVLSLRMDVQDIYGNEEEQTAATSFVICGEKGHVDGEQQKNYSDDERLAVCESCGEMYEKTMKSSQKKGASGTYLQMICFIAAAIVGFFCLTKILSTRNKEK